MALSRKYSPILLGPLFSTGLALSSATALAESGLYPHQQWTCKPGADGGWECNEQETTPGVYPKPPVMAPTQTDRHVKTDQTTKKAGGKKLAKAVTASSKTSSWDWVSKEQLKDPSVCRTGCDGAFEAPEADWPDADKHPDDAPMRAEANNSSTEGDVITLEGDVAINQGNRQVKADDAILNRSRNELALSGNIEIREPDQLIRGDKAFFDTATGFGRIENARFVQHSQQLHGTAEIAERTSEYVIEMEQATFSQCVPEDEAWLMKTSDLTLDHESGLGTAKHARLYIGSVPVLYTPYLSFPIDDRRMSGFLFPTLGSGSSGFDLTAPYYLNLAPNYDATIAPRYVADRGAMAEAEFRKLNHYGQWTLAGSHLSNDDITGEDRWLGTVQHEGKISRRWTTGVDYTKVSDDEFFDDFTLNSIDARRETHLDQRANVTYTSADWISTLRVIDYQTIDDNNQEPYKRLPQLIVENRGSGANFAPDLIFLGEYTEFDHDESIDEGGTFAVGQRIYGEAGISYPMHWPARFIVPTLKARHVSYDLDEVSPGDNDSPSTTTPVASLDMGLIFERSTAFGGTAFTQTLEPRLYYLYSDYKDQSDQQNFDTGRLTFSYDQLFRDTRFSGHDRLDDADQVSVGVTTRFLNDETGDEVFSASIGQIFYFDDRRVSLDPTAPIPQDQLSNSNIAGGLFYQPHEQFWLTSNLLWDSRDGNINEGGFGAHYQAQNQAVYNLGSRYRRNGATNSGSTVRDLNNVDGSVVYPLSEQWKVFARYQYDIEENRSQEDLFGFEYSSCCWVGRIVYQRAITDDDNNSITRDNVVLLEFQLKGMGSLGSKTKSLLEESIFGYEQE
jgi:LPS-assembly protein